MVVSPRWWLGLVSAAALATATARPAETPRPAASEAKPPAGSPAPPERPTPPDLDSLSLPANAVVVICRTVEEGLGLVPQGVVLSPEKYQALLKEVEQLKRQLKAGRPDPPSTCKLTGEVKGELARFQVRFEFRTGEPQATVALGCQRAWARGATLDGRLPLLLPGDDGLVVQVDNPGDHQLVLELEAPVGRKGIKGGNRGFDFGLPRAAITVLEHLGLPAQATEIQVNGQPMKPPPDPQHPPLDAVTLGPADHLEVSWKQPVPPGQPEQPLLAAEGQIAVQVDHARVTTEAELTLQALRGEVKQWQIQVPPQVIPEVKDPRVDHLDLPNPQNPVLTVVLKEPSAEPLQVTLQTRQAQPGGAVPVGPFTVLGASRQQGTIVVSAPPDLRLCYQLHGDVSQREIPEDRRGGNAVAAFTYWNLPAPANPGQLGPAPLDLQVEALKGSVETRVGHELHLEPDLGWRVSTKIDVTPVRTEVDHLDVELPPGYVYDEGVGVSPADWVENPVDITTDPKSGHRTAHVKLVQ